MAYASLPGQQPAPTNGSALQKIYYHLFNSPQAQASGMAMPMGPASLGARINEANPGLIKWVMDKSGKIFFGPAAQYHEEMMPTAQRLAGGTIEGNRVNLMRDLTKAAQGRYDALKQAVARQWVEQGREIIPAVGVGPISAGLHPQAGVPAIGWGPISHGLRAQDIENAYLNTISDRLRSR